MNQHGLGLIEITFSYGMPGIVHTGGGWVLRLLLPLNSPFVLFVVLLLVVSLYCSWFYKYMCT